MGKMDANKLIYLAAPYSHRSNTIKNLRYTIICAAHAQLTKENQVIFSPISHCHHIAIEYDLPTDWKFWERIDFLFISKCDELWVLCLEGWKESRGVEAEINKAKELGLEIKFLEPRKVIKDYHALVCCDQHDEMYNRPLTIWEM
jgi:hypothetical protein